MHRALIWSLSYSVVLLSALTGTTLDAVAQYPTQSATSARSFWSHSGSVVYLVANGSSREFYYDQPRSGMLEAGARPGSLLFRGQSIKGAYVGTAYIFNRRCGQFPYEVSGPILDNYERVVLQGQAPRVGADCRIWGYVNDTLEFTLLNSDETSSPSVVGSIPPSNCAGILHRDQYGIRIGGGSGEGEGICVIDESEENKVLRVCNLEHYCRVTGLVNDCKDSGECSEITNVTSVGRR
jgi:hypothetical protein